jgi:hypothetical protein
MSNENPNNQAVNPNADGWCYDELKNLEKPELERRKLVMEIAGFSLSKPGKSKTRNDNTRTIILTLLPLLISVVTTFYYWRANRADAQMDLARKTLTSYKEKFIAAATINDSITSARLIAIFPNLTHDADIQSTIDEYKALLETLVNIKNNRQINLSTQQNNNTAKVDAAKQNAPAPTKADSTNSAKSDSAYMAYQNSAIKKNQPSQPTAGNAANVVKDIPVTFKSAANVTQNITDSLIKQFDAVPAKKDETVIKDYGTSWFKDGYFLQFDDMRVLLQYLDKRLGIQVQVCQTTSSGPCANEIKTKQWISYDAPLTVPVGNNVYRITLQTIDHAGANPFTLAAYIKVVKIKG